MNRFSKLALILAGYVAALFAAFVGVALKEAIDPDRGLGRNAGLRRFSIVLGAVRPVLAPADRLCALHLRRSETFWRVFSYASLVFAATGPILALLTRRLHESDLPVVGFFALLRVLATPLLCFAFFVFAFVAPSRRARKLLLASAALEVVAGGYAFFCLAVVGHWLA